MANTLKFGNGEWAVKEGSALAYNDENGNFKPLPFDFSRNTTATRVNKEGLIEVVPNNQPRIDFLNDSDGALLLEPQRSNLVTYSSEFSQSVWTTFASGETIVSNSVISPDGTLNADTLEGDGTATNVYVRNDVTLNTSVDYTFSIFAKKGTNDFLAISAEGFTGATNTLLIFDLNNSIVTNGTGNIKDYGNGWLRCSFTIAISTDGIGRFLVYSAYNGTTRGFPTSSDANGQNIYIYGAQLEQGSHPTSLINTSGTAVTRVGETCNNAGNDQVINSTEGVLYVEIKRPINLLETSQYLGVSDGSTDNRLIIGASAGSSNLRFFLDINNNRILDVSRAGFDKTDWLKIAVLWDLSEYKIFINGALNYTTTLPDSFPANTLNTLEFGNGGQSSIFYGLTKETKLYNAVLTDQELINLTTL